MVRKRVSFLEEVLDTARESARRAGEIQMRHFRRRPAIRSRSLHDVKLETDRDCERAVVRAIRDRFPDHAVLGEEGGERPGDGGFVWIVDPLDGTVNFLHGLPFFCVSVACYRRNGGAPGVPLAGAVFLPMTGEMFAAAPGRGADLNGVPLDRLSRTRAACAVVSVSFGKTEPTMRRMTRRLAGLLPRVRKARCLGAVAAELAYIAAGRLGGLIYEGIRLWDFAAGRILVEETGGFFRGRQTAPGEWQVAAGAPGLQALFTPRGSAASSFTKRRPVTR
ncbi:MAG: inositol monophosphatase [Desulfobacterales bacterium]